METLYAIFRETGQDYRETFNPVERNVMKEGKIVDAMTQLCYLQNAKVLPKDFQTLIADCSSIHM